MCLGRVNTDTSCTDAADSGRNGDVSLSSGQSAGSQLGLEEAPRQTQTRIGLLVSSAVEFGVSSPTRLNLTGGYVDSPAAASGWSIPGPVRYQWGLRAELQS